MATEKKKIDADTIELVRYQAVPDHKQSAHHALVVVYEPYDYG